MCRRDSSGPSVGLKKSGVKKGSFQKKKKMLKIKHRIMSVGQNNGLSPLYDYKCLEG